MLLEADTLIYDNNDESVTASGSVRSTTAATGWSRDQVTYDRRSRRLIAQR